MKKRVKRVKYGQLSLLFSLMIIGVLVLIVFMSISNYDKSVKDKLKGELATLDFSLMGDGGPCIDDNDIIMKLSSSTNSHGSLWNDASYTFNICYNNIFESIYSGTSPHVCKTGNTNKVLGLSDITNAHLEIPSLSNYETNICHGDLTCRNVSGDCDSDEKVVIILSADTNAHASNQSDANYPVNICCKAPSACVDDNQCSGNESKCNEEGICVQCLDDSGCSGNTLKCNSNGICVICLNDSDCSSDYSCNTVIGQCILIDTTPPIISSVLSSPARLSAMITWNTDENSNSSVNYGTNLSNMNKSVIDINRIMSHSIELSGLTGLTLYYYNITSCDSFGNCAVNGTNSFTTSNQTNTPSTPSDPSTPARPLNTTNNTRISFEDKSVEVGKLIEFSISAAGLNQSKLNYSVTNLPSGALFDLNTGRFSWTPSIAGEYTINFSVTDKKLTNIKMIRISVTEEPLIPTPEPSPTVVNYGTFIFWVIVIVLIIAIVIIGILIFIFMAKRKNKKQPFPPVRRIPKNPPMFNPNKRMLR